MPAWRWLYKMAATLKDAFSDQDHPATGATTGQLAGVNISGHVGVVSGDIVARDKIIFGPTTDELARTEARKLVLSIISNCYRRAFSMNFATRFARSDDFTRVSNSIRECREFIQRKFVQVRAASPQDAPFVHDALKQAELMEASFEKMKGFNGRLDGAPGSEELTARFIAMEESRVNFLISIAKLAERYQLTLPPPPDSGGVPFGASLVDDDPYHPGAEKVELSSLKLQNDLNIFLVSRGITKPQK